MALKDTEMHVLSIAGAALVTAALFVPMIFFTDAAENKGGELKDYQVIEATIAYKKSPTKQPQKQTQQAPTIDKPEGVSRDENKKPPEKKEEKKPEAKVDPNNPFGKFTRPTDDDGKPTTQPLGDFNGSEKGFAPVSTGDPYLGALRADMNYAPPGIGAAHDYAIGCIHIQPDGKIVSTTFDPPIGKQAVDDVQRDAEEALKNLVKARRDNPIPVPTHLLQLTTKWLCFKFTVQQE